MLPTKQRQRYLRPVVVCDCVTVWTLHVFPFDGGYVVHGLHSFAETNLQTML